MGGRREVHCVVAGSPVSHSLTPVLSLLVDFHLNQNGHRSIVGTSCYDTKDLSELLNMIDSPSNGFTMCAGSYGANPDNDLVGMIERYGHRLSFTHLRSTKTLEGKDWCFYEADHLAGDADMYGIVRALVKEQRKRVAQGRADHQIPMRPDHGHRMLDDLKKESNPGYSCIGRLRGLAELRGLEMGIEKSL